MSQPRTADKETVQRVLFDVIDEVNETLPPDRRLTKTAETRLFGRDSTLDSLGLVNLIVAFEQRLSDDLGLAVTLADEKAMSRSSSPFRTVETLSSYVLELIESGSSA